MRRVLVAVSGALLSKFLERVLSQLDWTAADLYLLHVIDTRPLAEFGLVAGGLPARSGEAIARLRAMGALGADAGQRMLEEAEALARARLPADTPVTRLQRTGVPEEEIIATAHQIEANLIVLGAAEDPAEPLPPKPLGPPKGPPLPPGGPAKFPRRHLSPTVRFVVDHAPCNVLLLYAGQTRH